MAQGLTDVQVQQMIDTAIFSMGKYLAGLAITIFIAIIAGSWKLGTFITNKWEKKADAILASLNKMAETQTEHSLTAIAHSKDIDNLKTDNFENKQEIQIIKKRVDKLHDLHIYNKQNQ